MATIEINGKKLTADLGSMIIEVADDAGIYIPRFCYHKKLSIVANCRMCLVEVEKSPKPLPACATPITDGMKIFTRSAKAMDAQKSVMEFLLINHPLDCPICDQGGECELQDLSMGYGSDRSIYSDPKRAVDDEDLGPLIASDMTRCIHCTRCVRFGQEVAGIRELGAVGRGETMEISTYVKKSIKSELAGNIIDLCPVGALTSKPFRFKARAWELSQKPSIAPHDCVGSNISVHLRRGEVMRVVPRANEELNETWISDRDRYSYLGLYSEDRIQQPLIKENGSWQEVDWPRALEFTSEKLQNIMAAHGADQIAAFAAPTATLEECYLLQKMLRALGCQNIDHRIQQTDFADQNTAPLFPAINIPLNDIEHLDRIFLIGSNIQREQPLIAHRVRKATLNDAQVICINPIDFGFNFPVAVKKISHPQQIPTFLAAVAQALIQNNANANLIPASLQKQLQNSKPTAQEIQIADLLSSGKSKGIFLGALALNHPQAALIRMLAQIIATLTGASIGQLTLGANSAGAWLAGMVPHRQAAGISVNQKGLTLPEALAAKLKAYLLFNLEPHLDCANPQLVSQALADANFVAAFSPYRSSSLMEIAQVILPIVPFTETSGTYVNVLGDWQSFAAVTAPLGDARPGWKVLRVLANLLQLQGFEYINSEEIRDELKALIPSQPKENAAIITSLPATLENFAVASTSSLTRITEWPIYSIDNLTRRSQELQAAAATDAVGLYMNHATAKSLQLKMNKLQKIKQGDGQVALALFIDERIPDQCALIHNGYIETSVLGESFGEIEVVPT